MKDTYSDEINRMFCDAHRRPKCDDCCYDFTEVNKMLEEEAGLRPERTAVDMAASEVALAMHALEGMKQMSPLPSSDVVEMNQQFLEDARAKIKAFEEAGVEGVKEALQKAMDNYNIGGGVQEEGAPPPPEVEATMSPHDLNPTNPFN